MGGQSPYFVVKIYVKLAVLWFPTLIFSFTLSPAHSSRASLNVHRVLLDANDSLENNTLFDNCLGQQKL